MKIELLVIIGLLLGQISYCFGQDEIDIPKPLFDYQKYALKKVKSRQFDKKIFEYDSLNNVTRSFSFQETDKNLKQSVMQKRIGNITRFPFFTAGDSLTKASEDKDFIFYSVKTRNENIKYYLKDIVVRYQKKGKQFDKIEGKLIIHVSSLRDGDYTYDEIYTADFTRIKKYYLPTEIRYYPIDDLEFKRPRIIERINYSFK